MNLFFDTSIWVEHLRHGALDEVLPTLCHGWVLHLDAVVAAELVAGCRSKREHRVVDRLCRPFAKAGRLLVPERAEFHRAASALSRLRQRGLTLASPGGALLDGLIAAIAVRKGGLLVTNNLDDFAMLGQEMPLHLETFAAFARRGTAS